MSDRLDAAEAALREKVAGESFAATVRFDIAEEGVLRVVDGQVTREDGEADVTISGSLDTFRQMFEGALSPATAFMTGRIRIDGDMGAALRLGSLIG